MKYRMENPQKFSAIVKNHGLKKSEFPIEGKNLLWQIETTKPLPTFYKPPSSGWSMFCMFIYTYLFNPINKISNPCEVRGASWIRGSI